MADVNGYTVTAFEGLNHGMTNTGNHAVSTRRRLDTPIELRNMVYTERGHLWMPPSPDGTLCTPSIGGGDGLIKKIVNFRSPVTGLIVQAGTRLSFWETAQTEPMGAPDITYDLTSDEKIWVVDYNGFILLGNITQTIKVTYSAGFVFEDISASVPEGYHSINYKGRRFVIDRPSQVWYSDIGDPETFGDNSFFLVGADTQGDSWENNIGSPVRLHPFQEVLLLMQTQGIQRFTGTDPLTDFTLRTSSSNAGIWARESLVHSDQGVLFFGGTPRGEWGVYLFRGDSSVNISASLAGYLREWGEVAYDGGAPAFDLDLFSAVGWHDKYVSVMELGGTGFPEMFVYDLNTKRWSTFDDWSTPCVGLVRNQRDLLCIGDNLAGVVSYTASPMCRSKTDTAARLTVGYEDEEQPSGLARYLEVRLTVNALALAGANGIEVDLTATTAAGASVIATTQEITTDGQQTLRIPLHLRGNSIELDFTFTPSNKAHELVIESLELVQARKPLKVARIGGA